MAPRGGYEVGDSFASWNIFVSTNEPSLYMRQVAKIVAAAKENGFDDVDMSAYSTLTGPMAGKALVAVGMPSSERLGEFLDQLSSEWMAPIMADLAGIREYVMGVAMECTVVHLDDRALPGAFHRCRSSDSAGRPRMVMRLEQIWM